MSRGTRKTRNEVIWLAQARRAGRGRLPPRKPKGPSVAMLVIGGVLMGAGLGWFVAPPYGLLVSSQRCHGHPGRPAFIRSEEHTSELQSLMRISYAVFCLKKKKI